jgi:hypothetical protein
MPARIIVCDQNQRAGEARVAQVCQAFLHKLLADSPSVVRGGYRQMIDQPTAAVMSA